MARMKRTSISWPPGSDRSQSRPALAPPEGTFSEPFFSARDVAQLMVELGFDGLPPPARSLNPHDIVLVVGLVFIAMLFIPLMMRRFFYPDVLPPQVREVSYGFRVAPNTVLNVCDPAPNSGVFVLPSVIAPARRIRVTISASRVGT